MILAKNYGTEGWAIGEKEMYFPDSVAISHDTLRHDSSFKYNVLCLMESEAVIPNYPIEEMRRFDLVITWRESVLEQLDNSVKLLYGTSWIDNVKSEYEKDNKISFLTSTKNFTSGHNFRQSLIPFLENINNINGYKIDCFVTPPRIPSKDETLNDYKFSIVVENDRKNNYFTEKIIDCFITKTIPIYWGCPNIGQYFDMSGIIEFNDISHLTDILGNLEEDSYLKVFDAVENNYNTAQNYLSYWDRIENQIREKFWG
jgi:hypothetical protein